MATRWSLFNTAAVASILLTGSCAQVSRTTRPIDRINHVIVIFQENWSFDGLYFIETRWNLAPLGTRDAAANDLTNAFDFSRIPSRER